MAQSTGESRFLTASTGVLGLLSSFTAPSFIWQLATGKSADEVLVPSLVTSAVLVLALALGFAFLEVRKLRAELNAIFFRGPQRDAFQALVRHFGFCLNTKSIHYVVEADGRATVEYSFGLHAKRIPVGSWRRAWGLDNSQIPASSSDVVIDGRTVVSQSVTKPGKRVETFTLSPPLNPGETSTLAFKRRPPPGTFEYMGSTGGSEDGIIVPIEEPVAHLHVTLECRGVDSIEFYSRAQFADGRVLEDESLDVSRRLEQTRGTDRRTVALKLDYPIAGVEYELGWKKLPAQPA